MNKKLFFTSLFGIIIANTVIAATLTPWWEQPTVCRISTTNCYATMGVGYDREFWDTGSNCRGMKLICPDALVNGSTEPQPIGKKSLNDPKIIKINDFDTNILADGCFGARKTSAGGAMAQINGKPVNVWCRGILSSLDIEPYDTVTTGEITLSNPTCKQLANEGYAAVINNKCYGKYYNPNEYYLDCGSELLPTLVILNGADYQVSASAGAPKNLDDANAIFKQMLETSQEKYKQHFEKK